MKRLDKVNIVGDYWWWL